MLHISACCTWQGGGLLWWGCCCGIYVGAAYLRLLCCLLLVGVVLDVGPRDANLESFCRTGAWSPHPALWDGVVCCGVVVLVPTVAWSSLSVVVTWVF